MNCSESELSIVKERLPFSQHANRYLHLAPPPSGEACVLHTPRAAEWGGQLWLSSRSVWWRPKSPVFVYRLLVLVVRIVCRSPTNTKHRSGSGESNRRWSRVMEAELFPKKPMGPFDSTPPRKQNFTASIISTMWQNWHLGRVKLDTRDMMKITAVCC